MQKDTLFELTEVIGGLTEVEELADLFDNVPFRIYVKWMKTDEEEFSRNGLKKPLIDLSEVEGTDADTRVVTNLVNHDREFFFWPVFVVGVHIPEVNAFWQLVYKGPIPEPSGSEES